MKLSHRGASQRWLPYAYCGRQRSRSSRSAVSNFTRFVTFRDHGTVRDRQDLPRKVQHAEGIRRASRCRFKKVWSVQKHLAELVTILFPFCCHLPICYLSPSCFAPASFPGSCLGGNSGQRWPEMKHLEHRCFHLEMSEYLP